MSSTRLRRSPEDRKDRIGGIDALVPDPPVLVRGLYDTGGFLDIEALLSSDAVLCKALGSNNSRWPEKLSLFVALAGNPPEAVSVSCPDGVIGEVGARLFRTFMVVSVDSEGDLTLAILGRALALSSDVDRVRWVGDVVAGKEADSVCNVDGRDLAESNCSDSGVGKTTSSPSGLELRF